MDETPDPGIVQRGRSAALPRSVVLAALSIVTLIVIAVVALKITITAPADLAEDTPAGVFQAYLVAYGAGDLDTAYGYFSSRVQRLMTVAEFERRAFDWGDQDLERQRIVLDSANETGDRATLHLRVESAGGGGLFDSGRYGWNVTVPLVREDGTWRIDQPFAGIQSTYYE